MDRHPTQLTKTTPSVSKSNTKSLPGWATDSSLLRSIVFGYILSNQFRPFWGVLDTISPLFWASLFIIAFALLFFCSACSARIWFPNCTPSLAHSFCSFRNLISISQLEYRVICWDKIFLLVPSLGNTEMAFDLHYGPCWLSLCFHFLAFLFFFHSFNIGHSLPFFQSIFGVSVFFCYVLSSARSSHCALFRYKSQIYVSILVPFCVPCVYGLWASAEREVS